jgi:pilus assembly protein CpaB
MAYFGGVQTDRPWSKVESKGFMVSLSVLIVAVIVVFTMGDELIGALKPPVQEKMAFQQPVIPADAKPIATMARVVVPKQTIWPGQRLKLDMFQIQEHSIDGLQERVFFDARDLEGSYASAVLVENAPVLRDHVNSSLESNPLTSRIPAGHRAVTIKVDAESAIEGWVRPGVRVDLVWTSSHVGKLIASTIVENALVLSAERSVQKIAADARTAPAPQGLPSFVTLLVNVKDAQKVHLARRSPGSMSLSLRGDADTLQRGSDTIAIDNMLRSDDMAALNALQGKVEYGGKSFVLRGGKLTESTNEKEKSEQDARASLGRKTGPVENSSNPVRKKTGLWKGRPRQ